MHPFLFVISLCLLSFSITGQKAEQKIDTVNFKTDCSEREAILTTLENFYIGDHTGSIKHKKLSMHEKGAYRYINRDGEFKESIFELDDDHADPNYQEELLGVEIYDKVALARLRLDLFNHDKPEYKLITLHKAKGQWKITSICWGFGITY